MHSNDAVEQCHGSEKVEAHLRTMHQSTLGDDTFVSKILNVNSRHRRQAAPLTSTKNFIKTIPTNVATAVSLRKVRNVSDMFDIQQKPLCSQRVGTKASEEISRRQFCTAWLRAGSLMPMGRDIRLVDIRSAKLAVRAPWDGSGLLDRASVPGSGIEKPEFRGTTYGILPKSPALWIFPAEVRCSSYVPAA